MKISFHLPEHLHVWGEQQPLRWKQRSYGAHQIFLILWLAVAGAAFGQYYDSTAIRSADSYLAQVSEELGPKAIPNEWRGDAIAMASTLGALDRISVPSQVFVQHLKAAKLVRNRYYTNIPDEAFRDCLLPIRIRYESTSRSNWRPGLMERAEAELPKGLEPEEAAPKLLTWVKSKVKVLEPNLTYPLGLKGDQDPVTTFRGEGGSEIDVTLFAIAALRSAGIAARLVYAPVIHHSDGGKVWLEYRGSKDWIPWVASAPDGANHKDWLKNQFDGKWAYVLMNPAAPVDITPRYSQTTLLWSAPKPLDSPEYLGNIMLISAGRLQPLMCRDIYNPEPAWATRGFGPGNYAIMGGNKESFLAMRWGQLTDAAPGWFLVDLDENKQFFTQSKTRPVQFDWDPQAPVDKPAEW